jgi:hypothetical protein
MDLSGCKKINEFLVVSSHLKITKKLLIFKLNINSLKKIIKKEYEPIK